MEAAHAFAAQFVALAEKAITLHGHFVVALSGGRTPQEPYHLLATDDYAEEVDWGKVYVFWSDERCVPHEHPDSNSHMARVALLDRVPIPRDHIFRVQTQLVPEQAAADYEATLRSFFASRVPGGSPRFDLANLGVGSDGHTASLFPNHAAVDESERWVVAEYARHLDAWRITMTLPALNSAANILFYVTGEDKAEVVRTILERPAAGLPAQRVQPVNGQVTWILDSAAASQLTC
jgi:6-phosphogluconolactonase